MVEGAMNLTQNMEQLLYIGSVGYSGSTLLDMVLGLDPNFTALGEVAKLAEFHAQGLRCTCGIPVSCCEFWTQVERALGNAIQGNTANQFSLAEFPLISKRVHPTIHRLLPTLPESLLLLGNKMLWSYFTRRSSSVYEVDLAARNSLVLFDAIAGLTNSRVIVDSSKEPVKLKSLYLADPERFRLIFLIRDGRAVTLSQMKHKNLGFEDAARRWARYNFNLRLMMRSIPTRQIMLMRYEDLCRFPRREIDRVYAFLGISRKTDNLPLQLDKAACHNIGGNPMRRRFEESDIVLDEGWRRAITQEQMAVFERIAGHWNQRFGYE
jgi:Sulfotransferase domain